MGPSITDCRLKIEDLLHSADLITASIMKIATLKIKKKAKFLNYSFCNIQYSML